MREIKKNSLFSPSWAKKKGLITEITIVPKRLLNRAAWDQADIVPEETYKGPSIFVLWIKIFVRFLSGIVLAGLIFVLNVF